MVSFSYELGDNVTATKFDGMNWSLTTAKLCIGLL